MTGTYITVVEKVRESNIKGYPTFGKGINGYETPYPDPLYDWDLIRRGKKNCRQCRSFEPLKGGCLFMFLPTIHCKGVF